MDTKAPNLHFFCGLIGSGKSTLARRIADENHAVLIAEDAWLSGLWPGELNSIDAYRGRSRRLKSLLWPHVGGLLARGLVVVLDFPANNRAQRESFRELVEHPEARHVLHYLDAPPELCRERLVARNAQGDHPFAPSDEDFDLFARLFEPPASEERFTVKRWPCKE